jgi:hypothetical protein
LGAAGAAGVGVDAGVDAGVGGAAAARAEEAAPKMPETKEKAATIDTNNFIDKLHARAVWKEIADDSRQFRRAALFPARDPADTRKSRDTRKIVCLTARARSSDI